MSAIISSRRTYAQSLIFISDEWQKERAILSDVCMSADRLIIISYTQLHLSLTFHSGNTGS